MKLSSKLPSFGKNKKDDEMAGQQQRQNELDEFENHPVDTTKAQKAEHGGDVSLGVLGVVNTDDKRNLPGNLKESVECGSSQCQQPSCCSQQEQGQRVDSMSSVASYHQVSKNQRPYYIQQGTNCEQKECGSCYCYCTGEAQKEKEHECPCTKDDVQCECGAKEQQGCCQQGEKCVLSGVISDNAHKCVAETLKDTRCVPATDCHEGDKKICIDITEKVTETHIPLKIKCETPPAPPPPPKPKPKTKLHIEFLQEQDVERFVRLVDKCAGRSKGLVTRERVDAFRTCYQLVQQDRTQYLLVCKDQKGTLYGALSFDIEFKFLHECAKTMHLQELFIANKKHKVILSMLLRSALAFASKNSCYRVTALCTDQQEDLFEQLGFRTFGPAMIKDL